MPLRDEDKGQTIISEAALRLALAEKEININFLLIELGHMATDNCHDERLNKIFVARTWLREFITPVPAEQHALYLQILASLNE